MVHFLRRMFCSTAFIDNEVADLEGRSSLEPSDSASYEADASWSSDIDDVQVPPEAIVPLTIWMF